MIYCGDCIEILRTLPDQSVHCCVTSPPYYGLRDYGTEGQLGLEATPEEYVAKLVAAMREVRRVLRDDGTLWLNLGDSYAGGGRGRHGKKQHTNAGTIGMPRSSASLPEKNLLGIPWRVALALQADGWILRQDIIWAKPNPMPESVTDRCTKSHEYMFLLSKSPRYYYDAEAIKEMAVGFSHELIAGSAAAFGPPQSRRRKGNSRTFRGGGKYTGGQAYHNSAESNRASHGNMPNESGLRNKRDVWTVATVGYEGAHFATFPPDLIRPCIRAGCPPDGTVLDPYIGSGTTALVAIAEGRQYIGIDINPAYCAMARERVEPLEAQMRLESASC